MQLLKRGAVFFPEISTFFAKKKNLHWNETGRFHRVLKIFQWFFVLNEVENSHFVNQKFLFLTSFSPTFLTMTTKQIFEILILAVFDDVSHESWAKKLARGLNI